MSTHIHIVLTDVRGCLPRFLQEFHRLLALTVKVLRKWEGAVWDHEKTSVVELRTQQAIVEKLAYVMANPVAAGLVEHAGDWPGIKTLPDEGHGRSRASRPAVGVRFLRQFHGAIRKPADDRRDRVGRSGLASFSAHSEATALLSTCKAKESLHSPPSQPVPEPLNTT